MITFIRFSMLMRTTNHTPSTFTIGISTNMRCFFRLLRIVCWKCWDLENYSTWLFCMCIVTLDWIYMGFTEKRISKQNVFKIESYFICSLRAENCSGEDAFGEVETNRTK